MSGMITLRRFIDFLLFVVLIGVVIALSHLMPLQKRGFFCGDESLQYPFTGRQTFGFGALCIVALGIPFFVILTVELFRQLSPSRGKQHGHVAHESNDDSCRCGRRWKNIYARLGYYLLGMQMTLIATEIPKRAIGRLRPYFFSICKPRLADGTNCDIELNEGQYFAEYTCENDLSQKMMAEMAKSFPSGHSSLAFYAMVYIALYLQVALSTRGSKLLKHFLQFGFVMLAWLVALTRVTDHWHHWSDVLVGILLGTLFALLVARYVAKLFEGRCLTSTLAASEKIMAHASIASASAQSATPALPAYTFGSVPYLQHHGPNNAAEDQTYRNYGYVA
ncbi:PREDICTED: putative phosphatidate phosphatase [Rhagoletis zephyria]|uniref:putative phosphatidate phosphatase n=1 Tax=Rhagoletis zephyria TaxID=28612 RepID=UPI00081156AD|nr:PREDICTED: putative phosphatidate phosphatase [Rhagoletis zephyria]